MEITVSLLIGLVIGVILSFMLFERFGEKILNIIKVFKEKK
jgi:uncharacterized membrane protein YdjX (TVP38/TMEM64 family)